ncbi:hypothetical protein [Companilactobacillus sp.]|uniref:hypothetical protein n=1 Tax=Companilactobacillus sp. TaxID=2767905 RepID=UPI0025B8EDBC|nr:hypothetical protein [Companilactobacillus sp.]MCH4007939.1 hypothetical protein [Companilactobacillus sp.]MCH4051882.1 hypothetical protein [Companilactobacillus sp.]MCH4075882.1 hypothetical protein [Companilactobacillus sp.]MCH4124457.1 hypothetical protein [Companilactobacillus sp.]MCH4132580.1 hypothetical protein [Companilactobacillus sp.]
MKSIKHLPLLLTMICLCFCIILYGFSSKSETKEHLNTETTTQTSETNQTNETETNLPTEEEIINEAEDDTLPQIDDYDQRSKDDGWKAKDRLFVSSGFPSKAQSDGCINTPVLYFGSLNYALQNMTIKNAVNKTTVWGNGPRINNVTAANSGIITVPQNGDLYEDMDEKSKNTYYTTTNGDAPINGNSGSFYNFTTTNIRNYDHTNRNSLTPNISGPDALGIGDEGIKANSVKLFSRIDPETGLEEQRLVFEQFYRPNWLSKKKYQIKIQITQRFNNNNDVEVHTDFINVGNQKLNNFTGYIFRDITFIKNDKIVKNGSNNILHSLGVHEGLYAVNPDFGGKLEFKLNREHDSPYAWAGRGTRPWYFINEQFPWSAKDSSMDNLPNVFKNIYDQGDKARKDPGAGEPWINRHFNSGVSMHTENTNLDLNEKVSMSYTTHLDIKAKQHPNIVLADYGTEDDPDITENKAKFYSLKGSWFDYLNNKVDILYTLDDKNMDHAKKISSNTQTDSEMSEGKNHPWSFDIPLNNLNAGVHIVRVIARSTSIGENGEKIHHDSDVHKTVFLIDSKATKEPQIEVLSPDSFTSKNDPYTPNYEQINFSGAWSDADSKTVDIFYQIDNQSEVPVLISEKNKLIGKANRWEFEDFSVNDINDNEVHTLKFIIRDPDGHEGQTKFFFKLSEGKISLFAPRKINFGSHNLIPNRSVSVKPSYDGQFLVNDTRTVKDPRVRINLTIGDFYLNSNKHSSNKQKLNATVYWKNSVIPVGKKFNITTIAAPDHNNRLHTTDFSQEIDDNLSLKITTDKNIANPHQANLFNSHWQWEATDSI